MIFYSRRKKVDGTVGAMYCILYSIGRFFVEFLRNDYRGNVGILSTSQFIAIACLGAGIALHVVFKNFFAFDIAVFIVQIMHPR